jgi:hypothetical protein
MSIQDSTAGGRRTPVGPGRKRDRKRPQNATVTSPSHDNKLADAWLEGNPRLVETNKFFALAIEPDAIVEGAPGRKERKWVLPTLGRRVSARGLRA